MQSGQHPDKPYTLATGEKAASRLDLFEQFSVQRTRQLLSAAGLCSGMLVAEIGCGIGLTARWVSKQVGPSGSVTGVDSSSEQLNIGEKSAGEAGTTNLTFAKATRMKRVCRGILLILFTLVFCCAISLTLSRPWRK